MKKTNMTLKDINILIDTFQKVNKHFTKTNWLNVKDYIEIIEKSKKQAIKRAK